MLNPTVARRLPPRHGLDTSHGESHVRYRDLDAVPASSKKMVQAVPDTIIQVE